MKTKKLLNILKTSCSQLTLLVALTAFVSEHSQAAIMFNGPSYSQTFNSLATSGSANSWINDTTIEGWHLFDSANNGVSTYRASTGSENNGAFYSYGASASTERALGGVGSGGFSGYIALALRNNTGATLNDITVAFDGEQWRNGGNLSAQTMIFQYGFGSTFSAVATWNTPGGTFDYSSAVTGATAAAVDGNGAGLAPGRGGIISNLGWVSNDTLWIRWIENNDSGNDHGLAIDNFSISATAVPEPSSWLAGALLALPFGVHGIRHLRNRKRA